MTELTHPKHALPLPEEITTLASPLPAIILNNLNEDAKHTLSAAFEFVRMAFMSLDEAVQPFVSEATPEEIFYLTPQEREADEAAATPNKLTRVIESAVFITTTRTPYTRDCVFFCYKNERPHKLSAPYQRVLENVIFKIQGVQYYLDIIDHFWNASHHLSQLTNKEYMARSMAVQLQCASRIREEDGSLNLESVDLILRLAHQTIKPNASFNRVVLTHAEHNTPIALIGVFLISKKPNDIAGEVNPCVLYVPGTEIQQFDSIASVKIFLATYLINPAAPQNPLPYCVSLSQQSVLRNLTHRGALDEHSIGLTPVPVSPDFFSDHIQLLIDQQKQDITYMWSQTEYPTPPADLPGFVHRYYINRTAFEFFGKTVVNKAIPELNAWEKNRLTAPAPENNQPVPPLVVTPSTPTDIELASLRPIKLHIMIHEDLGHRPSEGLWGLFNTWFLEKYTFISIKEKYFSWLIEELEYLSGRRVELIEINMDEAPKLHTLAYTSEDHGTSIDRWEEAVTHYIETTGQPTSQLHKYILLTRNYVVPGKTLGVAELNKKQFAIASLERRRTAAHEVGHLLGAMHEDGEIIYNGWWSETTMRPFDRDSRWRTNSYRFSEKNRARIRTYLSQFD